MDPLKIPTPLMLGPKKPEIRIRIEEGIQYHYSISNYNLYIENSEELIIRAGEAPDIDYDVLATDLSKGCYTLDVFTFPAHMSHYPGGSRLPGFVREQGLSLPYCREISSETCQMLEAIEKKEYKGGASDTTLMTNLRRKLLGKPDYDKCPLFSALLNCTTTPAERKFAEAYYNWAICGVERSQAGNWAYKDRRYSKSAAVAMDSGWMEHCGAPALLPQVWLNYTYEPTQNPKDAKSDLGGMPMRVDFLFVNGNKMHVVEIDDPSHYGTFDKETRRYQIDEEIYTDNLRVERALREQGMEIHRLSNWEVLNSTESQLIQLIHDALGLQLTKVWSG